MSSGRRGSWSVTAVNGVVAGTVLVLVAVLALVVKPPAPPGIAAFAPQANKPITKAPNSQSARFGSGAGACGQGQVCAGRSATPAASPGVAAVGPSASPTPYRGALPPGLQCYEWPDGSVTQTFDPQSPPCIARWDDTKGNGGATSQGVTGSQINVVLPVTNATSNWPTLQPLVDFFNTRFQFYGRKIKIVPVHSLQADQNIKGPWNDPSAQRADASQIAAAKPFATLDFTDPIPESSTLPLFLDAMARAKIISVNGGDVIPLDTASGLAKRAPYAWSYYTTTDDLMKNVATMVCRQLVGRSAVHAGDPALHAKTRKFAIYLPEDADLGGSMPGLSSMLAILDACGVHAPHVVRQHISTQNAGAEAATMQQLKAEGVTSLIFLPFGANGYAHSPLQAALNVGFEPEWVLIGWYNYNTAYMLRDPTQETSGAFGVANWNKQPQLALEPWYQAAAAVGGEKDVGILNSARPFYQEMLLLASGIQMAGPHLTPQSFAAGLHSTQFPNPGGGTAPSYQGTVGFPGTATTMVQDYTGIWLDTRTSGTTVTSSPAINEEKAFCEVAFGRRWTLDTWPGTDGYYQPGVCR